MVEPSQTPSEGGYGFRENACTMRCSSVLRRRKGKRALAKRLRFVVWLPLVAALCAASAASAVPMRPAVSGVPFSQISDAAAKAALQNPVCPAPTGTVFCYSPVQLSQAYDFPNGQNATGAGQTIVIV